MSRTLLPNIEPAESDALGIIADGSTAPTDYRRAMATLGQGLAARIVASLPQHGPVAVVCTPEDADTLAAPLVHQLESQGHEVRLVCFWNDRQTLAGHKIAPIQRRYVEPGTTTPAALVILKSIISGGCVVRTNLLEYLSELGTTPPTVIIAAPVARQGAQERLAKWLPPELLFSVLTLATDTEVTADGTVVPGVGGNVYKRMGWADQADKNRSRPALVSERNARWMAAR